MHCLIIIISRYITDTTPNYNLSNTYTRSEQNTVKRLKDIFMRNSHSLVSHPSSRGVKSTLQLSYPTLWYLLPKISLNAAYAFLFPATQSHHYSQNSYSKIIERYVPSFRPSLDWNSFPSAPFETRFVCWKSIRCTDSSQEGSFSIRKARNINKNICCCAVVVCQLHIICAGLYRIGGWPIDGTKRSGGWDWQGCGTAGCGEQLYAFQTSQTEEKKVLQGGAKCNPTHLLHIIRDGLDSHASVRAKRYKVRLETLQLSMLSKNRSHT